ncbi:hypothetical protein V6N13_037046 [Hibiscus sabdariffa]
MTTWKGDADMAGVNHCQDTWFATQQKHRIGSTKGMGSDMHARKSKRIGGLSRWSAGPKDDDTFGGLRFARELGQQLGEQNQSCGPPIICQASGRHLNVIGLNMDQWRISNAMQSVPRWFLMWSGLRDCRKWIMIIHGWANNYTVGFAWLMKAGLRKRVSMQRPDGFEGPFQYGDWLKVDMGQPLRRKKLGIVYKNPRRTVGLTEGGEGSTEERSMGIGKGTVQKDRGRTGVSGGLRFRTSKRMLQGKNEVCNPIAMKKSRQSLSCQGCDEDEVSEATSPIKIIPTVEAAGQPRREP